MMKKKINELNTLDYAYADYLSAVSLYQTALELENEIVINYSGYHLQQAVEKAIKFQLEEAGIPYDRKDADRKDDIYISKYVRDFSEMFTTWKVQTRYVKGYLFSIEKLETGLKEVKKYLDEVREKHNELMNEVEGKPLELEEKINNFQKRQLETSNKNKNEFER